jgi:protein kinase
MAGELFLLFVFKIQTFVFSCEECKNLREVRSLRKLNHPNIIKLKEVIREKNQLYFVFEFMDCNLYELLKEKQRAKPPGFRDKTVRNIMFQVTDF